MRRVLQVTHQALPGGHQEMLLSLLRHAPGGVHNDCVYLAPGPVAERAQALGARTAIVESGRARHPWRAPAAIRGLRGAIRATRADVVVAHVTKAHLYAWAAARLENVPYLWVQVEERGQRPVLHEISGRLPSGAVICLSDRTAAEQRRWRATPVHRVYPGAETTGIGPAHEQRAENVVLGVVGRLQRWKRVELALAAMPEIVRRLPGTRLRVVGGAAPGLDEDYPAWLAGEARRLGVADAVEFTGPVPDGGAAIADIDVLVHCAEREPFGLVVVEAMLRGVPVVAMAEGGPTEILRDGIDGRLVDATDPAALAAAVVTLGADTASRARMGAAARERAFAEFTAARWARDFWAIAAAVGARAPARTR